MQLKNQQQTMPNTNLRAYDSLDQPPDAPEQRHKAFVPLVVVVQIAGLLAVVLSIVWMGLYAGGFDWSQPEIVFNYHPVFMVLGLVFCFGDVKVVHAILMLLSLLFAVVGLKAAFDSHNLRGIPNLYSIHSWIGIIVTVLFGLQVCLNGCLLTVSYCSAKDSLPNEFLLITLLIRILIYNLLELR
ncbi:unnamed protein product [Dibothriocephalus latus]|uniref:Cytochrome b561 domain-containing protein n=1 Tax=Dibothriocephalus latus TaxID=60516 RepID=A0A3P6TBM2_DIBLA|nr:unnamed protein product [Dibothriocephalus latus]